MMEILGTFDRANYENYEWDDIWVEKAKNADAKRVLYIGDSVARGIRRSATALSGERLIFDGYSTSKGIDNPWIKEQLCLIVQQNWSQKAVLFNNGLHGWHLDPEAYGVYFEDMLRFLRDLFPETPIFPVLTTTVASGNGKSVVAARNDVVRKLAQKYDLPVIDLYDVSLSSGNFISHDGIHPTQEGYELLAKKILKVLEENRI